MSKYFGKCFGPSTRTPRFSTQMPTLFIIKIWFTIKVNSICGAGQDTRNLCHKFNSQGPALRILGHRDPVPGSWVPMSHGRNSRVLYFQGPVSQGPRVLGCLVPGPRSRVSGPYFRLYRQSWGLGSRVLGPDFRICRLKLTSGETVRF